jgi:hypothetical protein
MKNLTLYLMLAISVLLLTNCNCHYCTDNISAENKKIPYQNKELVEFTNDTLGSVFDTVYVELGSPSRKAYGCNGTTDSDNELCWAKSYIIYSTNLCTLEIIQFPNSYNNKTGIGFPYEYSEYIKFDTTSYLFNNKTYTARSVCFKSDSIGSFLWKENANKDLTLAYNNYIYIVEPEIKLLEYSTIYKDGTRRIWRLKE